MPEQRLQTFVSIFRAVIGLMLGLTGLHLQANGSEGLAAIFYLSGLGIGIPGAADILIKLLLTGAYIGLLGAGYWFLSRNDQLSLFDLFRSHGPDWWRYFWWVPVAIVLAILAFAIALYQSLDESSDD